MSNAFECVTNGRADAPPCMTCSIGVSTSRKPSESKVRRRLALTFARAMTLRAGLLARDQVEVAAAHPRLVGQLVVQVRQRQDRLRGDAPLLHHDRELAAAARDDLARDEHVVAQVDELLPLASDSSPTSASETMAWMRLPSPDCSVAKQSLPVLREVHDAAGDADLLAGRLSRRGRRSGRAPRDGGRDRQATGYAPTPRSSDAAIRRSRLARRTAFCSEISSALISSAARLRLGIRLGFGHRSLSVRGNVRAPAYLCVAARFTSADARPPHGPGQPR